MFLRKSPLIKSIMRLYKVLGLAYLFYFMAQNFGKLKLKSNKDDGSRDEIHEKNLWLYLDILQNQRRSSM